MHRPKAAAALISLLVLHTVLPVAAADRLDSPRLVLKNNSHFLVVAPDGTMTLPGAASRSLPYGLYKDDTRYLCGLSLKIDGLAPNLVTAATDQGYSGKFTYRAGKANQKSGKGLLLAREVVIQDGLSERITIKNEGEKPASCKLTMSFDCDFKDMFEVRGQKRKARGKFKKLVEVVKEKDKQSSLLAQYTGLDGRLMSTTIELSGLTAGFRGGILQQQIEILPHGQMQFEWQARTNLVGSGTTDEGANSPAGLSPFLTAKEKAEQEYKSWQEQIATIECDDAALNKVFQQARRDLFLLSLSTEKGPALAAGLPWYAVPFGRDQVITARQILPFAPVVVKGLIKTLAAYQGKRDDPYTEETPGKIMHELRSGEMARTREIPFIPYYGTIDATPLWLVLVGEYFERTEDEKLLQELKPNLQAAIDYLKRSTKDVYLYYGEKADKHKKAALTNQAWKDSGDSVMHKDGSPAKAPIAICEVQGYLYQAWQTAARLSKILKDERQASDLESRAAHLKERFHQDFALESENFFALAKDATPEGCKVVASNAGHLLATGILEKKEEEAVSRRLMQSDMFSGWGIRTLSRKEKAYDPKSYHNGSVWPHDNAIIVSGMSQVSEAAKSETALKVIAALMEVARTSKDSRLPELFCGYERVADQPPSPYPVSCVPQAWCVGSIYQMVQAMSGLSIARGDIEGEDEMQARCRNPQLPPGLNKLEIRNLKVGKQPVDIILERDGNGRVCASIKSTVR
ncbi:MAG TPA: glycogen debranching N-terminal domain-containing protein [Candidatus Obscuribacter sp.]|nr:glycogen debranching N-terminal domain-containing protein [Candidatus Obscuribacter sp.]